MKLFTATLLFFTALFSHAQDITIGTRATLPSSQVNEEREYWVYVPEHYADDNFKAQRYPVIYVLDGETYFHVISGIVNTFSSGYYPVMPECIVVAIKNTDRSRDLTPTPVTELGYQSGGADKFRSFIIKELMPKIDETYRTLDFKILVGHSFGGLFTMNTLFENTGDFNAYVAIDPSLWWDDALFVNELEGKLRGTDFKGKTLFLANANSLGYPKKAGKQDLAHFEAKEAALTKMHAMVPENLNLKIKAYPEEDHGSVVLPAMIDAFRFVFKGFRINVKDLIKNPSLLQEHYRDVSETLGYELKPQGAYLDRVVDLARARGQQANAVILHRINRELYPENQYLKEKSASTKH
ncbi:alpha/beta hydrolase [Maribacter polysaccharolyticus]|uniref:alpha/beta hydrolase n=1 Tax=Maribacter polysaccharolyticus TaxID=3020831 RepID=UPI00237F20D8|nr:alpha/beta hydrolase-fold protein [Maribacter polysaccharolyticus]MDE3743280.1 alpha/beta hydrolase-fold protein [Maribacter polysaccharolyticus]